MMKYTMSKAVKNLQLIQPSFRSFAPKAAKPAGGKAGGGPNAPATAFLPKRPKTILQEMVDNGTEFIMGPPSSLNKTYGGHRDEIQHKLEPRINLYARKLREMYFREGTIPTVKTFIDPMRERQPTDTLESCSVEKVVPGVINGRDEFPDLDLVFAWRVPFLIKRGEHAHVRPFYLRHPVTEEEIRVTCNNIDYHAKTKLPYYMDFQRYIVGRPNLLRMPVVPV